MKRKQFLTEFLSALGAESIEWYKENDIYISGRVIYDKNDLEETQDFCWHMSEKDSPNNLVLNLAKLLNKNRLLSIDQIKITREELRLQYNDSYEMNISEIEFNDILDSLERIEVPMVDEGKETDVYFIHE